MRNRIGGANKPVRNPRRRVILILCLASLPVVVSLALAQSNPSAENCEGLGMLDVECFNCKTGEYLGKINVVAGYNEWNKDCLQSKDEARNRCSGAYGVPVDDIGMRWKYKLGMTEWKNWSPRNNCPAAAW